MTEEGRCKTCKHWGRQGDYNFPPLQDWMCYHCPRLEASEGLEVDVDHDDRCTDHIDTQIWTPPHFGCVWYEARL